MATTKTMVHVRVDKHVKIQATEILASMGLTVSDAICAFLTRVITDKELPFAINASTASQLAMAEAKELIQNRRTRFAGTEARIDDLEKVRRK